MFISTPILLALCSNICFGWGSLLFTKYSRQISSIWMNFWKAFVACICFAVVCTLLGIWQWPSASISLVLLCTSGLLGLLIGDIFLLKAFTHLGSGRVLMLFGFQPFFLGAFSFFLFGQTFPLQRLIAVLFLIGCLLTFAFESFRQKGHWDLPGLSFAFIGIFLDAVGILMTRAAFENSPEMSPFLANFTRTAATILGFALLSALPFAKFSMFKPFLRLSSTDRIWVNIAGFMGTFMSLSFYLMAIKTGHLATISAIAGTSPLFATLFETISGRKPLTRYLVVGTSFFVAGITTLFLFS